VTRDVNGVEIVGRARRLDIPTRRRGCPEHDIQQAKTDRGTPFNVLAQSSKQGAVAGDGHPAARRLRQPHAGAELDEVDATLSHLERILWGVGLAVLALTGLAAYLMRDAPA